MHRGKRGRGIQKVLWIVFWIVALGMCSAVAGRGATIRDRDNPVRAGMDFALAMDIPSSQIVSATAGFSPIHGKGVVTGSLGNFFPVPGTNTFAILSTGYVQNADNPNNSDSTTNILGRLNNPEGKDLVELTLTLRPPRNAACLAFDYAFYSEEVPEYFAPLTASKYPGTRDDTGNYDDDFTATIGFGPTLATFASTSVSTAPFLPGATATTYDGGTGLLTAKVALRPGDFPYTQIVLSLEDVGDSKYDTAVFLDHFRWSTDPTCQTDAPPPPADSDGDALPDTWETDGVDTNHDGVIDLDLPAMGADPNHKDIFVEADYMVAPDVFQFGRRTIPGHSHRPSRAALQLLIDAFANAPVSNPDGTPGIHLHLDAGSGSIMNPATGATWRTRSRSNALPHDTELGYCPVQGRRCVGPYDWTEFQQIKNLYFSPERGNVFHYAVFGHSLGQSGLSGISRGIPASDFIVTLGSFTGTVIEQAGTTMHELGHNLSLLHGGGDGLNQKPNYLSVMSYSFQLRGLLLANFFGKIDYSFEELPPLLETALNEPLGLNGSPAITPYGTVYFCSELERWAFYANAPIDWNCSGSPSGIGIIADVNGDRILTTLPGFNDWESLVFDGGAIGSFGQDAEQPTQTPVEEITDEEAARLAVPLAVKVTSPSLVAQLAGTSQSYDFVVRNVGTGADTYHLALASSLGWANPGSVPATLVLGPGQSATLSIQVTIPAGTAANTMDEVTLTATSEQTSRISDAATLSPYVPENPPIANAGPDQRIECSSQNGTPVVLDGSGSRAPSGGTLVYQWTGPFPEGGGTVSGARPTVTLPLGVSTITLRVNDGIVDSYPDTVLVNVVDTTPPVISVSVTPKSLWPPDHAMKEIRAAVTATDLCTPPSVVLASVTSSEPDDAPGGGDGATQNDIQGAAIGTPDFLFSVRAERAGSGPGRVYTARYTARDSSGNQASAQDQVKVPHNQ